MTNSTDIRPALAKGAHGGSAREALVGAWRVVSCVEADMEVLAPASYAVGSTATKSALIIDVDEGAGLAVAKVLGQLGYKVWIGDRSRERGLAVQAELVWEGYEAEYLPLDLADTDTILAAAQAIAAAAPCLDILVNNAGDRTFEGTAPTDTAFCVQNGQVPTAAAIAQAMLPLLRRSPIGWIVNLSRPLGTFGFEANGAYPWGPLLVLC